MGGGVLVQFDIECLNKLLSFRVLYADLHRRVIQHVLELMISFSRFLWVMPVIVVVEIRSADRRRGIWERTVLAVSAAVVIVMLVLRTCRGLLRLELVKLLMHGLLLLHIVVYCAVAKHFLLVV